MGRDPDARPAHLDLNHSAQLGGRRCLLQQSRLRRRSTVQLADCPAIALLSINLDRHEVRHLAACCRGKLAPPNREQSTGDAMARATSEMLAYTSKLSLTIRAFSSAVQRRRRRCP